MNPSQLDSVCSAVVRPSGDNGTQAPTVLGRLVLGMNTHSLVDSKSARTLAYADFMAAQQLPAGYTGPQSFTLWNLVRCDTGEPEVRTPGQPGGHYAGLNTLRGSLFRDRDENACSGNTITFTTKSGRVITITGTNGLSWSAAPAY